MNYDELSYLGTRLKYAIEIGAGGFNMMEDNFTVDIMRGPNTLHFDKEDLELDANGHFYVCFDTMALGSGKVSARVTAYVPDTDFKDGVRVEVQKLDLINIHI